MRIVVCLFIITAIYFSGVNCDGTSAKKKLKVFILAGQSNMEGHARIATFNYIGEDPATVDLFKEMVDLNGVPRIVENTWISYYQSHEPDDPAGEGFGPLTAGYGARKDPSKPGEKIGPEYTFGLYMQKTLREPILIIKTAWGGKSLYMDFRPPSAGPYELNETEIEKIGQRGDDLEAERKKVKEASGAYYRLMVSHVKQVLKDIRRVYPAYDERQGYEIAGFVWFQGWNDMVNRNVYPRRDQEGGYDKYSELMAMFIRDVRKDLKSPDLPFVIGVMGVNGPIDNVDERYREVHRNFRKAMAAPAALEEFKGNVLAVETAPYWDMSLDAIMQKRDRYNQRVRQLKKREREGELTKEQLAAELKKIEEYNIPAHENEVLKRGASNAAYHYMGSAKVVAQIGRAFARAVMLLLEPREGVSPRIVNIINFIRQCEPRIEWITEDVLYETVVEQIQIMKHHQLKGTFLLQYDALIDVRYQKLLKELPKEQFEIGAWWEIPQPLVEKCGYTWRGRFPWDWHADVGFATGYNPEEREKLVDTYMADFKRIFGYYPKSVGSWFIDAHTLQYLHDRYGIVASCNCKDQIGTDGYTLWGGYWNQAYYPSRKNAYMPAQHAENQIPVPIFRMLGSDPIHQYDNGLGGNVQRVVSLEPVYKKGGGNADWCNWYFDALVEGAAMAYAYVQTGQENSFAWKRMNEGFNIQMPLIAGLRDEGKIRIETLAESGAWFKERFSVTPPTSVTVLSDHSEKDLKTVWFNSRFYRANLLWENGTLRFRDIHVFDEDMESVYLIRKGTSSKCDYYTLPVVDGFEWSSQEVVAGLRLKAMHEGREIDIQGGGPVVDDSMEGQLTVRWPITAPAGGVIIVFDEDKISVSRETADAREWFLELAYDNVKGIPIEKIYNNSVDYKFRGFEYSVSLKAGSFIKGNKSSLRIKPTNGSIILSLSVTTN